MKEITIHIININFLALPQLPNPPALQRVYLHCRIKSHFQSITFLQTIYYLERYIVVNERVVIICRSGCPSISNALSFSYARTATIGNNRPCVQDVQGGG